jgi:hypothetical protein
MKDQGFSDSGSDLFERDFSRAAASSALAGFRGTRSGRLSTEYLAAPRRRTGSLHRPAAPVALAPETISIICESATLVLRPDGRL